MIRRLLLLSAVLLVASVTANAQDEHPRIEIYGTYSLLVADIDVFDNETLQGWGAGVQWNPKRYFGVVAEFGGNYGHSDLPPAPGRIDTTLETRLHTFLFGPRVSYRSDKVTPFAHFLLGPAINTGRVADVGGSNTEIALSVGGGLDINVSRLISIRPAQLDYLSVHSDLPLNQGGSSWFRDFRYQAGVVFKIR